MKASLFSTVFLSLAVAACGSATQLGGKKDGGQGGGKPGATATTNSTTSPDAASPESGSTGAFDPNSYVNRSVAGNQFQVKNKDLLRSSIESCVGPGMTTINANMRVGANLPAPTAELRRFVTRGNAGDDVLNIQGSSLYDPAAETRESTSSNALTSDYLQAADQVANVVAQNCTSGNALCNCGTENDARAFLNRCLPRIDPVDIEKVVPTFAKACAGSVTKQKIALASFFTSGVFLEAK